MDLNRLRALIRAIAVGVEIYLSPVPDGDEPQSLFPISDFFLESPSMPGLHLDNIPTEIIETPDEDGD